MITGYVSGSGRPGDPDRCTVITGDRATEPGRRLPTAPAEARD
jgi:hypothetical protein